MNRKRMKNPVAAGSVLNRVLDGLGLSAAVSRHRIVHLWPKIVDSVVARHAKAIKVSGNLLLVAVDSSVWMNELVSMKTVLIQKLNASLPRGTSGITDIRFQQRSWAREQPPEPEQPEPPEPDETDARQIRQILEHVTDDQVRSLLARILEKDRRLRYRRSSSPGSSISDSH
jgi:predicted nucleic acid-binding Zn ribbon protein